jgi:hypothetical protein
MNYKICKRAYIYMCFLLFIASFVACINYGDAVRVNQLKAKQSLLMLKKAQDIFKAKWGRYASLQELEKDHLIAHSLALGTQDGYQFSILANVSSYKVSAIPIKFKETGGWSYYMDETGVIRGAVNDGREATSTDPPVIGQ